jgi:Tol biopolymer transport system component
MPTLLSRDVVRPALRVGLIALAVALIALMFGDARLRAKGETQRGVGNPGGGLPTGKLGVDATRRKWADGSDVESGGLNYPTDIYVVGVRTPRVRNVTHDERTETSWSWLPDGRRILFASVPNDRMKPGPSHIFIVGADGRYRRRLTSGAGEVSPELAPGGRRFLFVGQGARHRGLYVMRVDGTQTKRLTHGRESPYEVSWSPDGRRILFVRDSDAGGSIFVIAANGRNVRRLTRTNRDSEPVWSPDGRRIAFIRSRDVWDLVYVMRSDGTAVKKLTSTGHNDTPYWLSNQRVAYKNLDDYKRPSVDWSVDADGTGKRRAVRPPRGALSPDAKWVSFVAYDDPSHHSIWVAHPDGTGRRLVTRRVCCMYFTIKWAPK